MKSVVLATVVLLAGAAVAPPTVAPTPVAPPLATPDAPPAPPAPPPGDYTTRMSEPALLPEYDPNTAPPAYASAPGDPGGLRQCVGADGVPVFTDRRCEDVQATPIPPSLANAAGPEVPGLVRVRSCARNQDDLLAGVRAALESHDANRLADYYHWTGMGTAEGYRLMDRLGAFSARPVVDVQLVRSALPEADPFGREFDFPTPPPLPADAAPDAEPALGPREAAAPHRPRLAVLLRVDQMRSDTDAASTITYFHLLTNAGCWWMRF